MTDPELDHQHRETISRFFAAIQAGEYAVLQEVLTPDAITRWPQSGERMTSAMSCIRVYENYPGGPPSYEVQRISGGGERVGRGAGGRLQRWALVHGQRHRVRRGRRSRA